MFRVFIRFSINSDDGTVTTRMRNMLEGAGFVRVGTGAYEATGITSALLATTMRDFFAAVQDPVAAFPGANVPADVTFDHVWAYCGLADDAA